MGFATKDSFRAADVRTAVVPVPGVGDVRVRELTGEEWDAYERRCTVVKDGRAEFKADRALLVVLGAVGGDDGPLFDESDLAWLRRKGSRLTRPLANKIGELTGLGEDVEKNSETTPAN
jgi:hypothetical protein